MVITVALVESRLDNGVIISTDTNNSTLQSVRTDRPLNPIYINHFAPSPRIVVESWTLAVFRELRECAALATLGSGGGGLQRDLIAAPVCTNTINLKNELVAATISEYMVSNTESGHKLQMIPSRTDLFELLLINRTDAAKRVGIGTNCTGRGISNYFSTMDERALWHGLHTDSDRAACGVHATLCALHDRRPVVPMRAEDAARCMRGSMGDSGNPMVINVSCVTEVAEQNNGTIQTVEMNAVNALIVTGRTSDDAKAFACVDSTVKVEYVFFPGCPQLTRMIIQPC